MSTVDAERALNESSASDLGRELLNLDEDQWLERKSSRISPRSLADTLIGFANADGGIVVVGLHDGKIEGTETSASRRNSQMQAHIDFCSPPVRVRHRLVDCINEEGVPDKLLAIEVATGETVHANGKDEVYLRVGDENRRL